MNKKINEKINQEKKVIHKPVMVAEVLKYLKIEPNKTYLDVTFGGGGHTKAILEKVKTCKVIAFDWDKKTIEKNAPPLQKKYGKRLKVLWGNFALIHKIFKKEKIIKVDGILADFGISQIQIEQTPGISFQKDTPLDMRISKAHYYFKASDILNRYSEKNLTKIFFDLGEEKYARQIAKKIVEYRKKEKFKTTGQLTNLVEEVIPKYKMAKRRYYIHPATKVFQALRIFVNKELENMQQFLSTSIKFLTPKSRIVCISFHSLEDRIIKNFFKEKKEELKIITPKPIIPTQKEIKENASSRSAKLRTAEKI
ncbi:16S rRNA (cytosine(1402)-N(4))-methyltransferase RsmH [Candidatus Babeliales bacterium]|nr:16S rRNA (cytosine(1402)-N(4))-methyltransferase RsmH [Candidatus Babeliales bacterium]